MTDTENNSDPSATTPSDPTSDAEERDGPRTQGGSLRKTPPPLPAVAQQAPAAEVVAPIAKRGAGKTVLYAVILLALLALAGAAGLGFGDLVQGKPATSTVIVPPAAPTATAAVSAAEPAPSATTVTLPAVEIK